MKPEWKSIVSKFIDDYHSLKNHETIKMVVGEGPDGTGKTALLNSIYIAMRQRGIEVKLLKDERYFDTKNMVMDTFEYSLRRATTMTNLIRHVVDNKIIKQIVLYDRFIFSNFVYQIMLSDELRNTDLIMMNALIQAIFASSMMIKPSIILYTSSLFRDGEDLNKYRAVKEAYDYLFSRMQQEIKDIKIIEVKDPYKFDIEKIKIE